MLRSRNWVLLGGTALALLAGGVAQAQTSTAPQAGTIGIEDIVVTARKTEELIQTTPVTMQAFSSADLDKLTIQRAGDLQYHTAGLQVGKSTAGPEQYTLRGQGTSFGQPSGVLEYFNMVPTSNGFYGPIYDLESVQVLKGPQGTLFGRTSTGGAVLFQPTRPRDEFGGYWDIEGGSRERTKIEGALNIPVVPGVLAVRATGYRERQDGYLIAPNGVGYNNISRDNFRIGALFTPTDWLENYTLLYHNRTNNRTSGALIGGNAALFNPTALGPTLGAVCGGAAFLSGVPGNAAFIAGCVRQRQAIVADLQQTITTAATQFANGTLNIRRGGGTGLNINRSTNTDLNNTTTIRVPEVGPLSNISIRNIFAKRLSGGSFTQGQEVDGSDRVFVDANINATLIPGVCATSGPTIGQCTPGTAPSSRIKYPSQWSNEVNLNFTVADRLDILAGHFYTKTHLRRVEQGTSFALASFGLVFDPLRNYTNSGEYAFINRTSERGIFVQGILDMKGLIDGLKLTGGYRWNKTHSLRVASSTPTGPRTTTDRGEKGYNYTISADYKVSSNLFVYVVRSRSFKPGGTNPLACLAASPPCALTFDQETLRNTEAGVKWDWSVGDLRGRTNVSVFTADNGALQRRFGRSNGATATSNAADARIRGFELEQNLLYRNLEISAQASHLDAKYTKWFAQQNIAGRPIFPCTDPIKNSSNDCADYSSSKFTGTPKWQIGGTVRYTLPIDERVGRIVPSLTVAYQTSVNYADIPLVEPGLVGPAYTLFNTRIEWNKIYGSSLSAAFFVRNLTNLGRGAWLGATSAASTLGPINVVFTEPRTFGGQLRYQF